LTLRKEVSYSVKEVQHLLRVPKVKRYVHNSPLLPELKQVNPVDHTRCIHVRRYSVLGSHLLLRSTNFFCRCVTESKTFRIFRYLYYVQM
jgi:hypothetical protein